MNIKVQDSDFNHSILLLGVLSSYACVTQKAKTSSSPSPSMMTRRPHTAECRAAISSICTIIMMNIGFRFYCRSRLVHTNTAKQTYCLSISLNIDHNLQKNLGSIKRHVMDEMPAVLCIIKPCVSMKVWSQVQHLRLIFLLLKFSISPLLYFSRRYSAGVDIDSRHFLQLILRCIGDYLDQYWCSDIQQN
jgi:hypothetical protein